MKIAFDYDDTLDVAYGLFSVVTHALIAAGHDVYIITHIIEEYRDFRLKQLKEHNIAYTELVISGDKLYECQKRGIEYIFDDCASYFKDLEVGRLQVFKIPPAMSKTLEDGYSIECALRGQFTLSGGIRNSYEFRSRKPKRKKWSEWEYINWQNCSPDKNNLDILTKQFNNFKNIDEVEKLWLKED